MVPESSVSSRRTPGRRCGAAWLRPRASSASCSAGGCSSWASRSPFRPSRRWCSSTTRTRPTERICSLTGPRQGLDLVATEMPSGVDSRRGIVRLSAASLAEIGGQAWAVVQLTAGRRTGALAALSPFDSPPIWMDDLLLRNLGAAPGDTVHVEVVPSLAADRLLLSASAEVMAAVPWQTVRLALLGKVVSKGDSVSLLQQDYALPEHVTEKLLDEARRQLLALIGPSWQSVVLTVAEAPEVPAVVTMSTVIAWSEPISSRPSAITAPAVTAVRPRGAAKTPLAMSDLAGAEQPAADLQRLLDVGLNHPDLLDRLGTEVSLGVLLAGPPGSGKVSVVYAVAAAVGVQVRRVSGAALASMPGAEAAQQLASMQPTALPNRTVLLVEDVEAVAPSDDDTPLGGSVHRHGPREPGGRQRRDLYDVRAAGGQPPAGLSGRRRPRAGHPAARRGRPPAAARTTHQASATRARCRPEPGRGANARLRRGRPRRAGPRRRATRGAPRADHSERDADGDLGRLRRSAGDGPCERDGR